MPTWTGPTQTGASLAGRLGAPGVTPAAHALFRHYGTHTEGRNFFILTNGTVTEADPADPSTVARTLFGGHYEYITDAEEALLVAAGYGAYIDTWDLYSDTYSDVYL